MYTGVWNKPDGAPQFTGDRPGPGWEAISFLHKDGIKLHWNGGGRRSVWTCGVERQNGHPTPKPLSLMTDMVQLFSDAEKGEFKMKKVVNQHGDLILYEVAEIPKGAKLQKIGNGYVIERGEGVHTHIFEDVTGIEVYEKDGKTFVRVGKRTHLNHEEHGIQTVMPGIREKGIERVWDYETEEARKVID